MNLTATVSPAFRRARRLADRIRRWTEGERTHKEEAISSAQQTSSYLQEREGPGRVYDSKHQAQAELDAWVEDHNQSRPHQAVGMKTPLEAFTASQVALVPVRSGPEPVFLDRSGDEWVTRKVPLAGVVKASL